VSEPLVEAPEELEPVGAPKRGALALLRRSDFRRVYFAVAVSELGDAFQYIGLMWFAYRAGGALGVVAVRLADSVPALAFGLHGGLVADRFDRRRTMITADIARAAVLVPVAALGLAGELPLWLLVVAAFALETGTSYFAPAYGALLPSLVDRANVQAANGLVRATTETVSVGGWALAALLFTVLPVSAFFALNAVSFAVSAVVLATVRSRGRAEHSSAPRIREGFTVLRPFPMLTAAVIALGVAVTISSGTWITGVPSLVDKTLHRGGGAFSLMAAGYALGSASAGIVLARRPVRRKARASLLAWTLYLPAYGAFAIASSLGIAFAGAIAAGAGQGSAWVLVNSAAQEDVPDATLGRVLGLISLTHRGAHATGLLLVSPLFAFLPPDAVFAAAAVTLPLVGLGALLAGSRLGQAHA
jgi:hypothetical protein